MSNAHIKNLKFALKVVRFSPGYSASTWFGSRVMGGEVCCHDVFLVERTNRSTRQLKVRIKSLKNQFWKNKAFSFLSLTILVIILFSLALLIKAIWSKFFYSVLYCSLYFPTLDGRDTQSLFMKQVFAGRNLPDFFFRQRTCLGEQTYIRVLTVNNRLKSHSNRLSPMW